MNLRRKYNWKFTLASFLVVIAFIVPSTFVHELGHGAICRAEGYDFEYSVGLAGGILECPGIQDGHLLFYFMGGGTAAEVFFAIGVLGGRLYKPIQVAGFTIGASNLMVAFLETFAHQWYMTASPPVVLAINFAGFMLWFAFVIYYHPKIERRANAYQLPGGR